MKAGISKQKITPPVGVDLTGYLGRPGPSNKLHDDLFVTALILDDGDSRIGIISMDVLGTDLDQDARLRRAISESTGIDADNLMIVATHTHAGPALSTLRECGEPDETLPTGQNSSHGAACKYAVGIFSQRRIRVGGTAELGDRLGCAAEQDSSNYDPNIGAI